MDGRQLTRTERRAQLAAQVAAFRRDGMTINEVAEEMGISHSYSAELFSDPEGKKNKERKDRYAGTCKLCGRKTNGSSGPGKASDVCGQCAPTYYAELKRVWTRERVIEAIQLWASEHDGVPPVSQDFRLNRDPRFPQTSSVYAHSRNGNEPFNSWNEAIEAAGFTPLKQGQRKLAHHDWSRERIVAELIALSTNGVAPPSRSHDALSTATRYYFGSWARAAQAAGLMTFRQERDPYWMPERIIEEIRALAIGDLPPALSEFADGGRPYIYGWFGSWTNAVRAAGFEPLGTGTAPRVMKRRELLAQFKNLT